MADSIAGVPTFTGRGENVADDPGAPGLASMARIERHPKWTVLSRLPLKLTVAVPIASFKVRDLLALEIGQMIRSSWKTSDDAPITVASVKLAVCEFEVVDQHLAVRLTRLTAI